MCSEIEVKKKSGEFDLESIYTLDLSHQALTGLGSLPHCTQLCVLNLSHNQLSTVAPLDTLTQLEQLDISSNQIKALDGMEQMERLISLNVAGNLISSLDSLLPLASLYSLRTLTMSQSSQTTPITNPVCLSPTYTLFKESPCNYIASLHWLDEEVVGGAFHKRVRQVCSQNTGEKSAHQNTQRIDELADPLNGFSLDHRDKQLSALLTDCVEVSLRVSAEVAELNLQLKNTYSQHL
ncbi:leucine-rich repeat-containing protein 61-like [Halichondria panicea]|uniref:leucine-rich repeat-containing protein 61-like n=1 Tax=Halichondria panicea TaxID=6063 RepID=UPI00312B6EAF